ncbi:MAG: hypothetical protein P0Y53_19255 [Candidatus Pseudobacter hemicellulosilyticus]|uniref:Uncharacterized protein n=1 Tax=Candidatus Pseudobacter hemicellulosilyticus TaxID=3121375 RepID=A0AAJ5WPY4_9BACT|nr:MAG: hypothetical protein P0Y53_19255 [Pseudobacter sp.]
MKSLLLIGSDQDLTKVQKNILESKDFEGCFTNVDLDARIAMSLSVKKDSDGLWIPYLHFLNEEDCSLFFKSVEESRIVRAFASSPLEQLHYFQGKVFEHPTQRLTFSVQVSLINDPEYGTYTNRLLHFKKVPPHNTHHNIATRVICHYPAPGDPALVRLYKLFLDPVEAELPPDKQGLLYNTFFKDRTGLPIALPPVTHVVNDQSYFHAEKKLVRQEMKAQFKKWYEAAGITETAGFKIWSGMDNAVFSDCFREGAWVDLSAGNMQDGQAALQPFYEDGKSVISLVYPVRDQEPDFLRRWRAGFLSGTGTDAEWGIITDAVKADMKAALDLDELNIEARTVPALDDCYWGQLQLPAFRQGGGFYNNIIEKFADHLPEVKMIIQSNVLYPADEGTRQDQTLALEAFCGHYWRYPFLSYAKNTVGWTRMLIELMDNLGNISGGSLYKHIYGESLVRNEAGEYLYMDHYRHEDILTMRLLLPAGVLLRSGSNNILDHINARLDNHFILD